MRNAGWGLWGKPVSRQDRKDRQGVADLERSSLALWKFQSSLELFPHGLFIHEERLDPTQPFQNETHFPEQGTRSVGVARLF